MKVTKLVKGKLSAADSHTFAALLQAKAQDAAPKAKSTPELHLKYFFLRLSQKYFLYVRYRTERHGRKWNSATGVTNCLGSG